MKRRGGFTLIELLITLVIIGILAGLFYGALQRAGAVSKVAHTKATIAKLNVSLMDRWDSYRSRRLPLDPKLVLASIKASGGSSYQNLQNEIAAMSARRIANSGGSLNLYPTPPFDPLSVPYTDTTGDWANAAQVAAVRLVAMRELMQYEMPQGYADFIGNFSAATTPGSYSALSPQSLNVTPPLSQAYVASVNAGILRIEAELSTPTTPYVVTFEQVQANESAECLYMILTIGSTDSGLFGEQMPTADVGDVDGDGLPEFQDAWALGINSYAPKGHANSPISFIRWPAGFVSSIQPDFFPQKLPAASTAQVAAACAKFCLAHHEYFDPLKLDIADASAAASSAPIGHYLFDSIDDPNSASPPALPRGYQLAPLIFSAGQDGLNELYTGSGAPPGRVADPFDTHPTFPVKGLNGQWLDSNLDGRNNSVDNVTNHELDTRTGK